MSQGRKRAIASVVPQTETVVKKVKVALSLPQSLIAPLEAKKKLNALASKRNQVAKGLTENLMKLLEEEPPEAGAAGPSRATRKRISDKEKAKLKDLIKRNKETAASAKKLILSLEESTQRAQVLLGDDAQ